MLTNTQLNNLKLKLIQQKKELIDNIAAEKGIIERNNSRESTGELSLYDNHPADMGTELFEREKDLALAIHAETELQKVEDALKKMSENKYGFCDQCGSKISFDRLEAIPYTTKCVDHADARPIPQDRPVEEDLLQPAKDNTFGGRNLSEANDYKDSFQAVAQYGTSETPSDMEGDYDHYNDLYNDDTTEGFTEEYESFIATNLDGEEVNIQPTEGKKHLVEMLDDESIDSSIGDIHYKESDGYVDHENK